MWDTIIGHEAEKVFLRNMLTGQRKTPSLLFYGPEGIGKRKMARAFAQSFLCLENPLVPCTCRSCQAMENDSHPDFIEVEPGGKSRTIGVDAIHELIAKAAFGPVLSPYRSPEQPAEAVGGTAPVLAVPPGGRSGGTAAAHHPVPGHRPAVRSSHRRRNGTGLGVHPAGRKRPAGKFG